MLGIELGSLELDGLIDGPEEGESSPRIKLGLKLGTFDIERLLLGIELGCPLIDGFELGRLDGITLVDGE